MNATNACGALDATPNTDFNSVCFGELFVLSRNKIYRRWLHTNNKISPNTARDSFVDRYYVFLFLTVSLLLIFWAVIETHAFKLWEVGPVEVY